MYVQILLNSKQNDYDTYHKISLSPFIRYNVIPKYFIKLWNHFLQIIKIGKHWFPRKLFGITLSAFRAQVLQLNTFKYHYFNLILTERILFCSSIPSEFSSQWILFSYSNELLRQQGTFVSKGSIVQKIKLYRRKFCAIDAKSRGKHRAGR